MSSYLEKLFSRNINIDNYLSNSYVHLTRLKAFHLLMLLIETSLNIFYELEIYLKGFSSDNSSTNNSSIKFIASMVIRITKLSNISKLSMIIIFVVVFDFFCIFIVVKKFKAYHIWVTIIMDIIEIVLFRAFNLPFLIYFFSLSSVFFVIACLVVIPHIYIIMNNFLYNHLYYFVPEFIEYPYDELSSLYDIILIIIKVLLSISGNTNNSSLGQFCYLLLFIGHIFFSFYFINILINHSYLLMKNSFLNRTRLCFFFINSITITLAILFGKSEIISTLFLIICICVCLILIAYMYFIYNPYVHICVKRETPMENLFFYLFILSEKNDFDFVFEKKIKDHFELCGTCDLCQKSNLYFNKNKTRADKANINIENDEREKLINDENNIKNSDENTNKKLIDLFDIICDNKNKYFKLVRKIVLNYKNKGKESLSNNSYYYINLSFLVYSDYANHNITLSLNERLILEVLNKENRSFIDNHESQIKQLLFCNDFIDLSIKILSQLKEIINSEPNFNKAKKMIDLSFSLKKMKNNKYKENLFSHKLENISNSKHLILICEIVYEEIFNTTINNSQLPIRDNIQTFEDTFNSNSNKINKIISLSVDIMNKSCRIIRAGKGLYSYVNTDLFNLFPLIFKQYQINLFMSNILDNFENEDNKRRMNIDKNYNYKIDKKMTRISIKNLKGLQKNNNKNKKDFIEIKLIIAENYSLKMYYKLLSLKLTPLFSCNSNNFIIFDGIYLIHKNTLITLQDFEDNIKPKEKIIGVSEPNLESNNDVYSFTLKKYISWLNTQGFTASNISSFKLSYKLYNIYILTKSEKESIVKKQDRKSSQLKGTRFDYDEDEPSHVKNTTKIADKIQLIEDNASVSSAQTASSLSGGITNIGIRNKKKDNIYDYGGFNRIKKLVYISIIIAIIVLVIEYIYLRNSETDVYNNNITIMLFYRDFTKLYYQLFSSILAVTCINDNTNNECIRFSDIFTEQYFQNNKDKYFNFTLFLIIQNQIFAKEIMGKRNYFVNIHKFLGNKKYNELFGYKIEYLRVSQSKTKDVISFNLTKVPMQLSEAILVICNSFQVISNTSYSSITLLNKHDNPFSNINNKENNVLNDYQKQIYEMILNYKNYYKYFTNINDKINAIISNKAKNIEIFTYSFIILDTLIIISIITLMLIYTYSFEYILVKIINYINMTTNIKNDDFNFCETFGKKIENLENILQLYKVEPTKCVNNLNLIYNNYHQYLNSKNKNNSSETNKKNYKKMSNDDKKNELDNIPKNQRIIQRKDVKSLGLTFIYIFMYYFVLFFVVGSFIVLLLLWINYFNKKDDLFFLLKKNRIIESSTYRAINAYNLMLFNNFTKEEVLELVQLDNKKDPNALIKSFYDDLKYVFDSKKEKNYIGDLFVDFQDKSEFTCENLYKYNEAFLDKIQNDSRAKQLNNITGNLIDICEYTKVTESKDYITVFERHFQYIRNGILTIADFSYNGLIGLIKTNGLIPSTNMFFDLIVINVIYLTNYLPNKESIDTLVKRMKNLDLLSEIGFLLYDIISILFVTLFYLPGINNLCNQIFMLRKTFKIFETEE